MSGLVDSKMAAKRLGVSRKTFFHWAKNSPGFPRPACKEKRAALYRLSDIKRWYDQATKDTRGRIILNLDKQRQGKKPFYNTLARQFICGAFDPARRRERRRIKSLVARHFNHHIKQTQHIRGDL